MKAFRLKARGSSSSARLASAAASAKRHVIVKFSASACRALGYFGSSSIAARRSFSAALQIPVVAVSDLPQHRSRFRQFRIDLKRHVRRGLGLRTRILGSKVAVDGAVERQPSARPAYAKA